MTADPVCEWSNQESEHSKSRAGPKHPSVPVKNRDVVVMLMKHETSFGNLARRREVWCFQSRTSLTEKISEGALGSLLIRPSSNGSESEMQQ